MSAPVSKTQAWVLAARPKTLPAAVVPVVVGASVAAAEGVFEPLLLAVTLLCTLLIQIGTNLANDYYDFIKGADHERRIGPLRVVQSGLLQPKTVRNVMILVLGAAFLLGLILIFRGGLPILLIGVASLVCAVIYTAGPFPLAYVGLGDIFAFVFFGVIAVCGTYYVETLHWSLESFVASLPVGALTTSILVVNNYRDIDTDREVGKKTLAVRFGRKATLWFYRGLILFAFAVPVGQAFQEAFSYWLLLPLLCLPLAIRNLVIMQSSTDGPSLNVALAGTAAVLLAFGCLYSVGVLLSLR